MKIERSGIAVETNVQGEKIAMQINTDALSHIMGVLTDLYQDPVMAIIREYATNALDAHVEAGEQRPIEVTTPTALRPTYTVRDYGPGLDVEDIRSIYSQYGVSTKRETNDAVGMLGLGCKSALAYVDQFNLTGWKDGTRTVVSVQRDEDGTASMNILEQEADDAPSGVEVNVPAKRDDDWPDKCQAFFQYWSPGSVQVNGSEPTPVEGFDLGEDLIVADRNHDYYSRQNGTSDARLTLVMGNVPYPVPGEWLGEDRYGRTDAKLSLPMNKRLIARVPIGSITIPPSRESTQDTAKSRNTVASILDRFKARAAVAVAEKIEEADSWTEAIRAKFDGCEALGLNTRTIPTAWKGTTVPDDFDIPQPGLRFNPAHSGRYGAPKDHSTMHSIAVETAIKATYVLNYDNTDWTTPQRRKLDRYLEVVEKVTDPASESVVLVGSSQAIPGKPYTDGCRRVDWMDVRKWKDPDKAAAAAAGGGRTFAGTYPTYPAKAPDYLEDRYAAADIDLTKPVYYVECGMYEAYGWHKSAVALLGPAKDAYSVVAVNANRLAKFQRTFPEAIRLQEAIRAKGQEWLDSLSEEERVCLSVYGAHRYDQDPDTFKGLEAAKDPDVARLAVLASHVDRMRSAARKWEGHARLSLPKADEPKYAATLAKYPILEYAGSGRKNLTAHRLLYVDTVYKTTQEAS